MRTADILKAHTDPAYSAKLAGVRYALDDGPGWTRTRTGKGFVYANERGARITKEADLARIASLGIPPAWKDVWIAPHPRGHLQATGIDAKGTKQYRYHAKWSAFREELKFSRLVAFSQALPGLRRAIANALDADEPTKAKAAAAALALVDELALRVGNDAYAKENETFGVTTLRQRHVSIEGDTIALSFVGKSSKEHEFELRDARLAQVLREQEELPGTRLFQYVGEDEKRHPLTAAAVNEFIKTATGGDFTAKDFRTWIGTVEAYGLLLAAERNARADRDEKQFSKELAKALKEVAERLGNTVAVCRAHYVHGALQDCYRTGGFAAAVRTAKRAKKVPGLGVRESETAALLRAFARAKR